MSHNKSSLASWPMNSLCLNTNQIPTGLTGGFNMVYYYYCFHNCCVAIWGFFSPHFRCYSLSSTHTTPRSNQHLQSLCLQLRHFEATGSCETPLFAALLKPLWVLWNQAQPFICNVLDQAVTADEICALPPDGAHV